MEKKALTYPLEIEHHDDGYLAHFPALPGCHTWGKTYEAAVRYAEEALSGYLETLAKQGLTSITSACSFSSVPRSACAGTLLYGACGGPGVLFNPPSGG